MAKHANHRSLVIWINRLVLKLLSFWAACSQRPKVLLSTAFLAFLVRSRYSLQARSKKAIKSPEDSAGSSNSMNGRSVSRVNGREKFSISIVTSRAELEDTIEPAAPKHFGHAEDLFEIGQRLKNGGHGIVYVCTRLATGSKYAAKIVNTSPLVNSQRELALLKREICIMRELHHPNIVNIFTAYFGENDCTIVMDLAEGGDLFDLINAESKQMRSTGQVFKGLGGSEMVSKHIANQLLEGIGYMHFNNVIHRDLKLDNILIMNTYSVPDVEGLKFHDIKIADFGLSIQMSSGACRTPAGTPSYVAPEVLDEVYDNRVDFWSFGVILYAMFCGQMPFHISSMRPKRHKEEVAEIQACKPWDLVSPEGQDIVRGLLTVDPGERLCLDGCLRHSWLASPVPCRPETCSPARRKSRPHSLEAANNHTVEKPLSNTAIGVVREISGWTGSNLLSAEMHLADGSVSSFGQPSCNDIFGDQTSGTGFSRQCSPLASPLPRSCAWTTSKVAGGGAVHNVFELEPQEFIIGVMQDRFFGSPLGNALVFYTSTSRIIALEGTDARRRNRFVAPAGWQIVGLQFQGSVLQGTHVERVSPELQGSVRQISGMSASAVEQVSLHLRDGSRNSYGCEAGKMKGPWSLEPSELVLVVEQGHKEKWLGASIAFYTSAGNVFKLSGVTAFPSRRFAVPSGEQLCNLDFEGGLLSRVCTCPRNGDLEKSRWHSLS